MKTIQSIGEHTRAGRNRRARSGALWLAGLLAIPAIGATNLADQPVFSNSAVPGNLALALSVEFPTAVSVASLGVYGTAKGYLGYFDPTKCYSYRYDAVETQRYFYPDGVASTFACSGKWSGSFLNWATMQTIDPFRWALTGGLRVIDTPSLTVIEKAWASGQGGVGNFPNRVVSGSSLIGGGTPFAWADFKMRVQGLGNKLRFTQTGDVVIGAPVAYQNPGSTTNSALVYELSVRVKVCDPAAPGGVEANCKAYAGGNWKPEGLIQKYSDRIRYSAFGYLNDSNIQRDGGVLRARQKFVGPTEPRPGLPDISNTVAEWDQSTGMFNVNPDASDANATTTLFGPTISNSGVINYLNKFGQGGSYKIYDPVGELYYAAVRYFKNLGNVGAWTDMTAATPATRATWLDGFPVINTWDDPIKYSCQKNYILGIGDVNTHADKNQPGATPTGNEPAKPSAVSSDTTVDAVAATNKVGALEGLGASLGTANPYNGCCNNNSALIAGVAYDAHTKDIRPDDAAVPQTKNKQTITTYWLDVLEYETYKNNNQYFLATKYGGFKVPDGYDPYAATAAPDESLWHTNTDVIGINKRPDNYYTAAKADEMVAGLNAAFASIASDLKAFTTSFSTASPQLTQAGNASYSVQYDAENWTGELVASELSFDSTTGAPVLAPKWKATAKLATQLAGAGWDTARRVVTWNGAAGRPFRPTTPGPGLTSAQAATLDTSYGAGVDNGEYLNYLRGDRSNEVGSGVPGAKGYRPRAYLLGDISGSKSTAVGAPNAGFSNAANPGYSAFKAEWAGRPSMVYVGSNDGMLHALNGSIASADPEAGKEVFAYVPSALYDGPTSPGVDGLAALGNPNFIHHFYVDATARVYDIDLGKTGGTTGAVNWRSMLIGGLGKGGKSYYAIDVTDPAAMTNETVVASKVRWEFSHANMGFSYGLPVVAKTAKHGWVAIFTSGYNNSDGSGYFFIVNPDTGALLEPAIPTGVGSAAAPAGLAHAAGFTRDLTDSTIDSVYAGDLLGNVWRLDLRSTGAYPAPQKIATLVGPGGAQPVTTRPRIEVHPKTGKRYVLIGTGKLLDSSDIATTQPQSFYAIIDGTASAFYITATLPTGVSFPIGRDKLVLNTDLLNPFTSDTSKPMGWYIDLGTGTGSIGYRMINELTAGNGKVGFVSTLPSGDACSPSGTSRVYLIDFGTGVSRFLTTTLVGGVLTETPVTFLSIDNTVTDFRMVDTPKPPTGTAPPCLSIIGAADGTITCGKEPPPPPAGVRRINWRELSTTQ